MFEDLIDTFSGWAFTETSNEVNITNCTNFTILGGYKSLSEQQITKEWDLTDLSKSYTNFRITFDFISIGTWNQESLMGYVNDVLSF